MPLPAGIANDLQSLVGLDFELTHFVNHASIAGIVDGVRNTILNWSLELEEQGILGEGLKFTKQEQEAATRTVQNVNNFFGDVSGSTIQQAGDSAICLSATDVNSVRDWADRLGGHLDQLELSEAAQKEIEADLASVRAQAESPRPKAQVVKGLLRSIRSVLEGAAGSVAGAYLTELIPLLAALGA